MQCENERRKNTRKLIENRPMHITLLQIFLISYLISVLHFTQSLGFFCSIDRLTLNDL